MQRLQCHARDLPWRRTRDPYAIWISEVMLQQTQVASVIPYFARFLQAFPSVRVLAHADEVDVLRLWEGLGYYRRARSLHRAARLLVADHHGELPNDATLLHALPGFGRYTVNAVLSLAFDRRLPILEAISRRVLCRLLGVRENPEQPDVEKASFARAAAGTPGADEIGPGAFNQAMMELGALVCTPVTRQQLRKLSAGIAMRGQWPGFASDYSGCCSRARRKSYGLTKPRRPSCERAGCCWSAGPTVVAGPDYGNFPTLSKSRWNPPAARRAGCLRHSACKVKSAANWRRFAMR